MPIPQIDMKEAISIDPLIVGVEALYEATRNAVSVSERNIGKIHTGRQRRSLYVFSKLIVHNLAIVAIANKFIEEPRDIALLDHSSIGALSRASIDAALMTMYMSEPKLTLERWDFRRQLLFLHDANNRNRFLKPLKKQGIEFGFYENYDSIKSGIVDRIRVLGATLLYSEEKIAEFEKGLYLFIDGVRGAVREAEWDVDFFEFNQSYLSAYVHSHPVSFMRADEHEVAFAGASKFQIEFCHYVLTMVAEYTQSVVHRMDTFSVPDKGDPNGHLD